MLTTLTIKYCDMTKSSQVWEGRVTRERWWGQVFQRRSDLNRVPGDKEEATRGQVWKRDCRQDVRVP